MEQDKNGEYVMIKKELLESCRIRKIEGPFGWIPRKFIMDGYTMMCDKDELLLYFFLVTVGDNYGLSFYGDRRMCELLGIEQNTLERSRQKLQERSLIAYKKPLYQVLSLPFISNI